MKIRASFVRCSIALAALVCVVGCAANSRLEGASAGTTLVIRGYERGDLPRTERLDTKATGQHEFMAEDENGQSLFGILPLHVNGAKMTTSILLFAPALFIGGFRDVFANYQVDVAEGVIRYRHGEADPWLDYRPTTAESERARSYFENVPAAN